jgi:hypothetical protein
MASQSEADRVKAEIQKKSQSWWEQMSDNVNAFYEWLEGIVRKFRLSQEVLEMGRQFIHFIKHLANNS